MKNLIDIVGTPTKLIFDKDNFKIYSFVPNSSCKKSVILNKYGNISIQGTLPHLVLNKEYSFKVSYKKNGNYNNYIVERFGDEKIELNETETKDFLCQVIDSKKAEILLSAYPNIIELILANKTNLIDVKKLHGFGQKSLDKVVSRILSTFAYSKAIAYFKECGFDLTMNQIEKIYGRYKSFELIKQSMEKNPYDCLCCVNGISFKTADAKIIKFNPNLRDSKFRMIECINFVLTENEISGNTYLPILELKDKCESFIFEDCMCHFDDCICDKTFKKLNNNTCLIKLETYNTEKKLSLKIANLVRENNKYNVDESKYTAIDGIVATEEQRRVLTLIKDHSFVVLTGFGGTGKSFSIQLLNTMLKDLNKSVLYLSTTGKASKVLADYTGEEVLTIHRGLKYSPKDGWFYNEDNTLEHDVVIVDESSMIDIDLGKALLEAINPATTKLLLIGDSGQLPSVSKGNFLMDLISSNKVPVCRLNTVFRYGEGGLAKVCTETRNGNKFLSNDKLQVFGTNKDFVFFNMSKEESLNQVINVYKKLLSRGAKMEEIMVLSAYNTKEFGTININKIIQNEFNKNKEVFGYKKNQEQILFKENDIVINTKNSYNIEKVNAENEDDTVSIFNGEMGVVREVHQKSMIVEYDGNILIEYNQDNVDRLLLGYCISIHKSQGSQAKYVICNLPSSHTYMLDRNLLYTAFSRSKDKVYCISEPRTVNNALKKSSNLSRKSLLCDLLKISI